MSKPWDGEQTPITDDIARGNHVVPTELAQDLERRLRHSERLLDEAVDALEIVDGVKGDERVRLAWCKAHLAAAKEAHQ